MRNDFDVKGLVRTLQQRADWKRRLRLDHLLNLDSFDVEFSPGGHVLRQMAYTNGGAIHRSSRFVYDEAGRLIRSTAVDSGGVQVAISEIEYLPGRRVSTTRDAMGTVTARHVEAWNGNLLTLINNYGAEEQLRLSKVFEYEDGKLLKAISKIYGLDGNLAEISITRFDQSARPIEAFGFKPDGKPNGDGRYVYEYDDQGRKSKVLSYNDLDDNGRPNSIQTFSYNCDEHGNWIERHASSRSQSDSDSTHTLTTRKLTYYAADGSYAVDGAETSS